MLHVKQLHNLCCGVYFGIGAKRFVTSGFHRVVDEVCVLLGYYVAQSGISLPTFRDNLLVILYP